jgi:DNA-binding MarR family transcriptional regulator
MTTNSYNDTLNIIFGDNRRVNILRLLYEMSTQGDPIYIRKIVTRTGYTPQTVTNHINELEKYGVIKRTQREGSPTKYIDLNENVEGVIDLIQGLKL